MIKAIRVLAILTFLACTTYIIRAILLLGETWVVDDVYIIQTLLFYLPGFILAILVLVYFLLYPGFVGIKTCSGVVIAFFGHDIITIPMSWHIGDTIAWGPVLLGWALFFFSLGLVLAIWTMVYYKKMGEIYSKSDEQENQ